MKKVLLIGVIKDGREFLDELASLAETADFEVIQKEACKVKKLDAGTYIGKGKIEELSASEADLVIFDDEITPNQQRNLEKLFNRPVMDRTELILEIFGQRAQTNEAKLQIELAQTKYLLPRLRRMWTHLHRQRTSGAGAVKGEGEKQIELDRRMVRHRISALQKEIKEVRAHREVQRSSRLRSGMPTFAIVGYTNAGKSTLLNRLTDSEILVEDKLFATLDTTTRKFSLPNHQDVIVIDTVGFIRKLPHTLVAAFKSTLEETVYTDILIHVVDISDPFCIEHAEATYEVLQELKAYDKPIITVLNKVDTLENKAKAKIFKVKFPKAVSISAKTGEDLDELLDMMMKEISNLRKVVTLRIPQSKYALVAELMEVGTVKEMEYEGNDILLEVEIPSILEHKVLPYVADDLFHSAG